MTKKKHFVVVAWGSMGDIHPLLGLSRALKARGHRVTFVTNEAFNDMAVEAGLEFHSVGTLAEAEDTLGNNDLWHPRKGFEVVWRSCVEVQKRMLGFILSQVDAGDLVIIAHPLGLPAAITARDSIPGLKVFSTWLAPNNLRTCEDPLFVGPQRIPGWVPHAVRRWLWRRVDADILDPLTLPDINALRASRQLPSMAHYANLLYDAPDHAVTLFPSWFGKRMPDWPSNMLSGDFLLYDGLAQKPLGEDVQQFLNAGSAPIVFTFGSAMQHAGKAFRASLDACRRLDRRGIFLTLFKEQIPDGLPSTVAWFEYAPFSHLLPHAAAVVHHGGIGSTAEALRAGIPQIVVPMAHDQFDNGARVKALGVGNCIARSRYRAGYLTRTLAELLGSADVISRCREVSLHFGDPDPAGSLAALVEQKL